MPEGSTGVRLRQAVLVARELAPVAERLKAELGLGEPYADPGVAEFGIHNAVFALGDTFLEVIAPTRPGTAAGRYLERHGGDGGYMAIFDLEGLEDARARAQAMGVRVVWQIDLPDISGTHLHPADTGGALISLDASEPRGSWRWGGPDWTGRVGEGAPGRLTGIRVAVMDPAGVATRWGEVLGVPGSAGGARIDLDDDGRVDFVAGEAGLDEIEVSVPAAVRRDRASVEVGGVTFRLRDEP